MCIYIYIYIHTHNNTYIIICHYMCIHIISYRAQGYDPRKGDGRRGTAHFTHLRCLCSQTLICYEVQAHIVLLSLLI